MVSAEQKVRVVLERYHIDVREFVSGKQMSILMIHGLGVSGSYFLQLAEILSSLYDIYIIDMPGYGLTPRPPEPLTIPELSDVVLQFVQLYKLKLVIALGHSMGCQVVVAAAKNKPSAFYKLILLGPTVYDKERSRLIQALRLFQDSFHESWRSNGIVLRDYLRMGIFRYLKTSKYMIEDHIEDSLPACTMPILLIRGEKDMIAPNAWLHFLVSLVPTSKTVEISVAPHLVHCAKPQEVADTCGNFIIMQLLEPTF